MCGSLKTFISVSLCLFGDTLRKFSWFLYLMHLFTSCIRWFYPSIRSLFSDSSPFQGGRGGWFRPRNHINRSALEFTISSRPAFCQLASQLAQRVGLLLPVIRAWLFIFYLPGNFQVLLCPHWGIFNYLPVIRFVILLFSVPPRVCHCLSAGTGCTDSQLLDSNPWLAWHVH